MLNGYLSPFRSCVQILAAHLCYCVASCPPALPDAPEGRYTLLGCDFVSVARGVAMDGGASLQRTEVAEWVAIVHATTAATAAAASGAAGAAAAGVNPVAAAADAVHAQMGALLPYKLLYAWELAEYGKVAEALSYCAAVEAGIRLGAAVAGGLPNPAAAAAAAAAARLPGGVWLMSTEAQLRRLQDRLVTFAQANSISLQQRNESAITKVGRFLDGTLNKLLWGGETAAAAGAETAAPAAGGAAPGAAGAPTPGSALGPQTAVGGDSVPSVPLGPIGPWHVDQMLQLGGQPPALPSAPAGQGFGAQPQQAAWQVAAAAAAPGAAPFAPTPGYGAAPVQPPPPPQQPGFVSPAVAVAGSPAYASTAAAAPAAASTAALGSSPYSNYSPAVGGPAGAPAAHGAVPHGQPPLPTVASPSYQQASVAQPWGQAPHTGAGNSPTPNWYENNSGNASAAAAQQSAVSYGTGQLYGNVPPAPRSVPGGTAIGGLLPGYPSGDFGDRFTYAGPAAPGAPAASGHGGWGPAQGSQMAYIQSEYGAPGGQQGGPHHRRYASAMDLPQGQELLAPPGAQPGQGPSSSGGATGGGDGAKDGGRDKDDGKKQQDTKKGGRRS